jgi:hypothetical protein
VIMEFPHEGRLLDGIPRSAVGPGEYLREGLFLFAVPDLRHHRVAAAVLQGLHPEVAVEEDKGCCHGHGDNLADTFDGGGQGKALFGPLYACMGIAEVELPDLDLLHLPKPVHERELTRGARFGPSRLLSRLSVSMGRKRPCANAF